MEKVLATVCMNSSIDKELNVKRAVKHVREAAAAGADWVLLPEVFHYLGPYHLLYDMAEPEGGPLCTELSKLAKELKIVLFAGTIGERPSGKSIVNGNGDKKVFNTLFVFNRDGSLAGKYRKTHLFNLYGPDGRHLYCEEDGYLFGDKPVAIEVEGYRVGLSICYDLRFSEYYNTLTAGGPLDVIVLPSAFTLKTGMDHWELLIRARAVEQQCYMFTSNQVGTHHEQKESYGHSMIVDPWGFKLCDTGREEGIAFAKISKERIARVRGSLPALTNKRPEVYKV